MNPSRSQPRPPAPKPKIPLTQLDADFLREFDNPARHETEQSAAGEPRILFGQLHQLTLHILQLRAEVNALSQARQADLKQIDENFQQLDGLLKQVAGVPDEPPPSEPSADEAPAPPMAEQEPLAAGPAPGIEVAGALPAEPLPPPAPVVAPPPAAPRSAQPQRRPRQNGTGGAP